MSDPDIRVLKARLREWAGIERSRREGNLRGVPTAPPALFEEALAAIDNPQPSDTGRYEEALREGAEALRFYSDGFAYMSKAGWQAIWKDAGEEARKGLAALDAALQPTGEKHGN